MNVAISCRVVATKDASCCCKCCVVRFIVTANAKNVASECCFVFVVCTTKESAFDCFKQPKTQLVNVV